MTQQIRRPPLFTGLVYDETGEPLEITFIGDEAHYIMMDGDFKRHIEADKIDRQVVDWLQKQALASKDLVSENIMSLLGKDDLFTKAMVDSSIGQMDRIMEAGLPDDARTMLGMMGFKIVVDYHGEVVDLDLPGEAAPDDEW